MHQMSGIKVNEIVYPKFRWYVLLVICLATIFNAMLLISPTPLVGEIAKTLRVSVGVATTVTMVPFNFAVAFGGLVGGMFLDKYGAPKTYIGCTLIVLIFSLLTPVFGNSVAGLAIIRTIQGLAGGPMITSGARLSADWFPKKQRATFMGCFGASLSLGVALGFAITPIIAVANGWNRSLTLIGLLSIFSLVMAIIFALGPKSSVCLAEEEAGNIDESDFKKAVKLRVFWLTVISTAAFSWVMNGYNDLTPGRIAVHPPTGLGLGPVISGQIMSMYQVTFMLGAVCGGVVLHKIFKGKVHVLLPVIFVITALFCGSVMLPGVYTSPAALRICLILAGLFMGIASPQALAFVATSYPEHITGRVGGITLGIGIFGGSIGVGVGAAALTATNSYNPCIIIVMILAIIGGITGWTMRAPKVFENKVC